jgi:hypothetical protein
MVMSWGVDARRPGPILMCHPPPRAGRQAMANSKKEMAAFSCKRWDYVTTCETVRTHIVLAL